MARAMVLREGVAASPRPPAPAGVPQHSFEALMQMHDAGILSKEEVRAIVLQKTKIAAEVRGIVPKSPAQTPAEQQIVVVNKPTRTRKPKPKPKRESKEVIKRKPASKDKKRFRKLLKNTTRRRFFEQCCLIDSILWSTQSGRPQMRIVLFEHAASDVVDLLYAANPGPLRKIQSKALEAGIRQQVMRDRNNFKGKKPKRTPYTGEPLPYDFAGELVKWQEAMANAVNIDSENDEVEVKVKDEAEEAEADRKWYIPNGAEEVEACRKLEAKKKAEANAFFAKLYKPCFACGLKVWIGRPEACPTTKKVAHPLGTNWQADSEMNSEPYCASCWKIEDGVLNDMSVDHRAVGKKRKTQKKTEMQLKADIIDQANKASIQNAIDNAVDPSVPKPPAKRQRQASKKPNNKATGRRKQRARKKPNKKPNKKTPATNKAQPKKTLGGWQGRSLPKTKETARWKVCRISFSQHIYQCLSTLPCNELFVVLFQVGTSVNARFHGTKKYYGAFVSRVDPIDVSKGICTYQVYFLQGKGARTQDNTQHGEIKLPLATGRNKNYKHWDCYIKKTFFDKGTTCDKTGKVIFEPGEFVVKRVCQNSQNFCCSRVDSPDEEDEFDISYAIERIREYEEE